MADELNEPRAGSYEPQRHEQVLPLPGAAPGGVSEVLLASGIAGRIRSHGLEDTTRMAGGLLLGDFLEEAPGGRRWVEIREVLVGTRGVEAEADRLTFKAEFWSHAMAEMERRFEDLRLVGWYLSRPNAGAQMPDANRSLHENFFHQEYQVYWAIDPVAGEAALYWYPGGARAGGPPQRLALPGS